MSRTAPLIPATTGPLEFVPLRARDFAEIELQESQTTQYGLDPMAIGWAEAEHYAAQPNCWTAVRRSTVERPAGGESDRIVLAILGVSETFPDAQGVAFALLSRRIGRDHLAVTRFARNVVIGQSPLARIEAIVRCRDIEPLLVGFYAPYRVDAGDMVDLALDDPTPEVRWAMAVGLKPAAVLRKFGAAGETHMLLERIG